MKSSPYCRAQNVSVTGMSLENLKGVCEMQDKLYLVKRG
jgi:hypothetical protein